MAALVHKQRCLQSFTRGPTLPNDASTCRQGVVLLCSPLLEQDIVKQGLHIDDAPFSGGLQRAPLHRCLQEPQGTRRNITNNEFQVKQQNNHIPDKLPTGLNPSKCAIVGQSFGMGALSARGANSCPQDY